MIVRIALLTAALAAGLAVVPAAQARTVHRCVRDGSVSLSTAPEPGSRCTAVEIDDTAAKVPNLWGSLGVVQGKLYRRVQDGRVVYGTRELPGATEVLGFTVRTPEPARPHPGLAALGAPRLDVFAAQFRATAKATGVDEALLRTIAHVESGFDRLAESPKGAQGLMQLMPSTAAMYGIDDPFSSAQSIDAGGRHLKDLLARYDGDLEKVAAAYNAGVGALAHYGGVPPFPETQAYVAKVMALHLLYRAALLSPQVAAAP